jgi:mannose-1-phosphate guanylyltransferase
MIPSEGEIHLYAIVMAGGSGTRFWPKSRDCKPKHFLNITGDAEGGLLRKTIERLKPIIPLDRIKVVTTATQAKGVQRLVPELPRQNIIIEPCGKNTAPAIGISTLYIERENPQAIMVIVPADHYIEDEKRFRERIMLCAREAGSKDVLGTIGVTPRGPETGYGYIEVDAPLDKEKAVFSVTSFHEKPDLETAKRFITQDTFFWNCGIFIATVSSMLREMAAHLPHTYRHLMKIRSSLGTDKEARAAAEAYEDMEAVSIDYGVMERSRNVIMVQGDFGWSDVGSWSCAAEYWPVDKDHNAVIGEIVNIDSSHCIVHSPKKVVALLGVRDLVVVNEDDALLICSKDRCQEVKKVVELLKSQRKNRLL